MVVFILWWFRFKNRWRKILGVLAILIPKGNRQDLEILQFKNPSILENIEIKVVKTVWEVLDFMLETNDNNFTRYS